MTPYDPDVFPSFEEWLATHNVFTAERIQDYDLALFLLQRTSWQYERLEHFHRHLLNEIGKIPEIRKATTLGTLLQHWDAIQRGRKTLEAAARGHAAIHGTGAEKAARWADLQHEVNRIRFDNPRLSWQRTMQLAAKAKNVSVSTIKRHCTDPKKLDQSRQ